MYGQIQSRSKDCNHFVNIGWFTDYFSNIEREEILIRNIILF